MDTVKKRDLLASNFVLHLSYIIFISLKVQRQFKG